MSQDIIRHVLGICAIVVFVAMAINYLVAKDYRNAAATILLAGVNGVLFT